MELIKIYIKKIEYSKLFSVTFLYWLTLQSLFRSLLPLFTADNYSFKLKTHILFLELYFFAKALLAMLFPIFKKESFLGFTMEFTNYLEFCLLFIEIFAIQPYKLRSTRVHSIIDGGSGWGMSVLYFHFMHPGANIIAIEPNPKSADILHKNIKRNMIKTVKIVRGFLSNKSGIGTFFVFNLIAGWSISDTAAKHYAEKNIKFKKIRVQSYKLSRYIKKNTSVIKLDIEGNELDVIRESLTRLSSVNEIVIEFHPSLIHEKIPLRKVLTVLQKAGFTYKVQNTMNLFNGNRSSSLKIIHAFKTS